ncbi:MAG TPA: NAD(P)/FAD-dependent oxidoreductase [Pseudonocardiaceae bacterium]|nr:NAD(P)/FAD-dependent oxidoreductase [Pseudonocardiaceae bacterium]
MSRTDQRDADVVVIGAGPSGLGAAITLRKAGFGDVVVLEKADRLGGTWRDNTYPGCGCDVPAPLYEYSFAPNRDWSATFAGQREILAYLEKTAADHGATGMIHYDTEVTAGSWDPSTHRWHLDTTAGPYRATAVILASGPWHQPRWPDIPGLADFPGPVFHSAQWNHDIDLAGRRIGVVGVGASAAQFVPQIQPSAGSVDIFQSTAPWVLPKPESAMLNGARRVLYRYPAGRRAMRAMHYWTQEAIGYALLHPRLLPPLQAAARMHLRRSIPDEELRRAATPRYTLGHRRLLTSNDYYSALSRPNVTLHTTSVTKVDGPQLVGANGDRVDVDAIILGTGFQVGARPLAASLHGVDGRALSETWSGGQQAYLGTAVSGYPNLFMLLGPNVLSGTTSAFTVLEAQLRYITDALITLGRSGHRALDVLPEVQHTHNVDVQKALHRTVYNTGDRSSYYFNSHGVNTFCWPWTTRQLIRRLHSFQPAAYAWQGRPT